MQKDRWQTIEQIFKRVVALPLKERQSFIEGNCGGDEGLRREILLLLEADAAEENFLDEEVFSLGAQILEADDLLLKQSEFANYRIKKLLGRGGMGAVYLAEDVRLERLVALKILPASLGEDAEGVRRFRQEARTASAISHPNVAHIYEFGEERGRYFLAMEYVEGKTLRELIKEKTIDVSVVLDIALQIAEALTATHRRGIVHRDIKPENVIVTESGLVKVLDFGVSKLLDFQMTSRTEISPKISLVHTTPGMVMGTIGYISPEQLQNKKVDFRADIWSLGVVFYEMLAGRKPFEGQNAEEVGTAILKQQPAPLFIPADNSAEEVSLQNVINKTLDKKAGKRYESAADLTSDLKQLKRQADFNRQFYSGEVPARINQSKSAETNENTQNYTFLTKSKQIWSRQSFSRKAVLVSALIGFLTLGIGLSAQHFNQNSALNRPQPIVSAQPQIESLAVLPFDNETGDLKLDFLSKGLADDLIRNLGQANAFPVISLSTAQKIKERNLGYDEINQNLPINTILEGKIKKENESLFIETRLVDLNNSVILWQEKLNIPNGDLLKLRNALTLLLSNKLQEADNSDKKLVFAEYPTANSEAYQLYLQAKFGRKETTVKEIKRLIQILEKAVLLDPNYTLALVALAENYNLLGTFLGQSPEYYQPKAKEKLEKALALDDSLSEAHTLLGKIKMDYERDWAGCEREFRRALEINPNNELAHHWYGEVYLSAMKRLDESISELEISHRLNPLSSGILTGLAWSYIGKGDYQKALELCDKAHQVNPDDNDVHHYRAQAFFKMNRFDEAVEQMDKAIASDKDTTRYYALKAVFLASGGKKDEAAKILSELKTKPVSKYSLAIVENALGNRDRAFDLLNQELKTDSVDLLSIKIDPLLDDMRHDSRFKDLEQKMNFSD
jgi:serine/threonine protein kinase/Tfp pilus assembly protein PilF